MEGRFHEKGMWANEGFCARQGLCRGFGQQSQWRTWAAQLESSYFHTASVPPLTKGLLFSVHPGSKPHWNSSGLPWLPGYLSHDDAKKWPNLEPLPLSSLFTPFQDNEASGCRGRPFYNFSTADTSVCLILGSGDSGARCFSS